MNKPDQGTHRGNKQQLPSKPCQTCGRPMTWRRAWAKNWDDVRHCSQACRQRRRRPGGSTGGTPTPGSDAGA